MTVSKTQQPDSAATPAPPSRAIILSAGQGTRLLPLTLQIPKCLVEVGGRTILDHQIECLRSAGIPEIVVIGGYRADQIREHADRSPHLPFELVINPFWAVANSIGSVWAARGYMREPFCLLNGDTIFDPAVIQNALRSQRLGVNLLVEAVRVPEPDDMRVEIDSTRVKRVGKDLPPGKATHRSMGFISCSDAAGAENYRAALQTIIESDGGTMAFHHSVIDLLARTFGVAAIPNANGMWREIDKPSDIKQWVRDHGPILAEQANEVGDERVGT